jgi:aryl-alcohol dehydrogenase-like predicted oxidoreductase
MTDPWLDARRFRSAAALIPSLFLPFACAQPADERPADSPSAGGAGNRPAPPPPAETPLIATDSANYRARRSGDGIELDIVATLTNRTADTVYLHPCGRSQPNFLLEKWDGSEWRPAYATPCPAILMLDPPRVAPGATRTDTARVRASTAANAAPRFELDPLAGTYRLVYMQAYGSWHVNEGPGELLPLEKRVSAAFRIEEVRVIMSLSRRDVLKLGVAGAGVALLIRRLPTMAEPRQALIRKAIPSSGEQLPVIGLGSAGTFDLSPNHPQYATGREIVRLFRELGGKVLDTSPTYQRSEIFLGETLTSLRISDDVFIATKVNVGGAGKAAAARQMEGSLRTFGRSRIDLIQVWNLGSSIAELTPAYLATHLDALEDFRKAGKVRYIGITTSRDPQYADVEAAIAKHALDFVQLDYSIGDRLPEQRLLPLAREKGVAVIVNRPLTAAPGFGRGRSGNLFEYVRGMEVPAWASDFGAKSWAQFFLKFVVGHPAVTVAIPATSDPGHLRDNMGAGEGRLPTEAERQRMARYFENL